MKRIALYLGPLGFAAFQLTGFSAHQSLVMGTAFWMLLWWFTEAIPLGISALIPLVTFGGTGVLTNEELANAYANPLIYLFMGGFLLARGIERHNLHRRLGPGHLAPRRPPQRNRAGRRHDRHLHLEPLDEQHRHGRYDVCR